jgi:hypothetical protein
MMPRVVKVAALSQYRLHVEFDDGVAGTIDLSGGPIYVINPWPEELETEIALNVFGVRAEWNSLSHAFVMRLENRGLGRSIYATHEMLLSRHGDQHAFVST